MANWPENPRLIGTSIPRLDGLAESLRARRSIRPTCGPKARCSAVMLYSPHAHAKIKSIDTSAAEKMPGVKAVITIAKAGATAQLSRRRHRRGGRGDRKPGARRDPRDQG